VRSNTVSEAARLLGISRPTLYGLMEAHGFPIEAAARSHESQAAPADATMKSY
jgi:DNA-binding NtrC family response regulator